MAIYTIEKVQAITVGTSEKTLAVNYAAVIIKNLTPGTTLYFKEKSKDNKAVTADNGFALDGVEMLPVPLRAKTLSLRSTSASTDVRILYVKEEV